MNGTKKRSTGPRVVYNKLLRGWYVVRGPHQTPIGGRFETREAALASLEPKAWRTERAAIEHANQVCARTGKVIAVEGGAR